MSKRSITVANLAMNEEGHFLTLEVYYNEGGTSMFSGREQPRGFYLSVTPCEIHDGFRSFVIGRGLKLFLEKAARFNQKRLAELVTIVKAHPEVKKVIAKVLQDEGKSLAMEEAI